MTKDIDTKCDTTYNIDRRYSECQNGINYLFVLSKDLRFDELRKVLESYGYVMNAQRVEAVITHSEKPDVSRLRYRSMNP